MGGGGGWRGARWGGVSEGGGGLGWQGQKKESSDSVNKIDKSRIDGDI